MTNSRELTRRDFLAASAVGFVALARGAASLPRRGESQMESELLYVGTYTEKGRRDGIYLVQLDRRSGKLRQVGAVDAGENPSFLAIHPNGRTLYAVNEVGK